MKVTLLQTTPTGEALANKAASVCVGRLDNPSDKGLEHAVKSGHLSILEHLSMTFLIENVSRSLTHQLVRHRIASYSQESQRYTKVNTDNLFGFSDKTLTVNSKHYEGFTPVEVSKQITIAADGSTTVDFYYTRNSYTITFVSNGGTSFDSETYKYEQQIPSTLKPTRTGFTFAGWYSNEKHKYLLTQVPHFLLTPNDWKLPLP